jgi:hypothetical protein
MSSDPDSFRQPEGRGCVSKSRIKATSLCCSFRSRSDAEISPPASQLRPDTSLAQPLFEFVETDGFFLARFDLRKNPPRFGQVEKILD